jgi:diguanylate cyclase (GGDEF)-like protein
MTKKTFESVVVKPENGTGQQPKRWVPKGSQLPLLDRVATKEEVQLNLTPLEKALYRLTCTVNVRTTPMKDAIVALMKELHAHEASLYLKSDGEEMSLTHFMKISMSPNGIDVVANGACPEEIVFMAFSEKLMLFSVPKSRKKGTSTLYQFNMIPGDIGSTSCEIKNGNQHICAVPLFMSESNGERLSGITKKLGVLVLKGKNLRLLESKVSDEDAVEKAALCIASGARTLSRMVDSRFDTTTGLPKKPEFDIQLMVLMERYLDGGPNFSLIMIDLDHFKRINDDFNHTTGNRALRMVANSISNSVRKISEELDIDRRNADGEAEVDKCFRWGGEEFAVLLSGTNLKEAIKIGERLRTGIEKLSISEERQSIGLSGSVGIVDADTIIGRKAESHSSMESKCNKMVREADIAMYVVKKNGRNKVAFAVQKDDGHEFIIYNPQK